MYVSYWYEVYGSIPASDPLQQLCDHVSDTALTAECDIKNNS